MPAAFTVPTGEAHWEVLLRARAIETGCYVIAAAQGGQHENGRADLWAFDDHRSLGQDRRASSTATGPGVLVADIDLDAVAEARGTGAGACQRPAIFAKR